MKRVEVPSYPVSIFIACDDLLMVDRICQEYCDEVGLCVTVTGHTRYIYTNGPPNVDGCVVGFINYPRFPEEPERIFAKAEALTMRLLEGLNNPEGGFQRSASIQAPDKTVWISFRDEDL